MANHLTPEELSKELGIDRQEVIRVCVQESVPIYQGKIDKTLFQAQLEASAPLQALASRASALLRRPSRASSRASRRRLRLRGGPLSSSASSPRRRSRLSASIRSIDRRVSSSTGSGFAISVPGRASPRAARAARGGTSLSSSSGSNSPTRLSITCRARSSSAFFTSTSPTASSISACE